MLVSEYVEHLVQIRPYKYATKQTLIRDVKKLAIWDKDIDEGEEDFGTGSSIDRTSDGVDEL